jgi:hypothetical protein
VIQLIVSYHPTGCACSGAEFCPFCSGVPTTSVAQINAPLVAPPPPPAGPAPLTSLIARRHGWVWEAGALRCPSCGDNAPLDHILWPFWCSHCT